MAEPIDELVIKLSADVSGLVAELGKVGNEVTKIADNTGGKFSSGMTASFVKAQVAVDALYKSFRFLKDATVGMVKEGLATIESQGKVARSLGLTTEAVAGLAHQAELANTSIETVGGAIFKMQRFIADMKQPTDEMKDSMRLLGVTLADLAGKTPDQQFGVFLDALQKIPNVAERNDLSAKILGRSYRELGEILEEGAEGIRHNREESVKLGKSFSEMDLTKVKAANDAWTDIKSIFKGLGIMLAKEVAQPLEFIAKEMRKVADESGVTQTKMEGLGDTMVKVTAFGLNLVNMFQKALSIIKTPAEVAAAAFVGAADGLVNLFKLAQGLLGAFGQAIAASGPVWAAAFRVVTETLKSVWVSFVEWINTMLADRLERIASILPGFMAREAEAAALHLRKSSAAYAASKEADTQKLKDELANQLVAYGKAVDEIVGDILPKEKSAFDNFTIATIANAFSSVKAFATLWASARPGDQLYTEWEEFKKKQKELNDSIEANGGGGDGKPKPKTQEELDAEQALIDAKKEMAGAALEAEQSEETQARMKEDEQYAKDVEKMKARFEETNLTEAEQQAILETMAQGHQARLNQITKAGGDANAALWKSGWQGKAQVMQQVLGSMANLMNSQSRKMFEIGKMAAMANVAIGIPEAAFLAYKSMVGIPVVGPALAVVAAAAAVANGVTQIQNIQSQSFGGGGGGANTFSGGMPATRTTGGGGGGGGESVQAVSINLQGQSFTQQDVRALIEQINESIGDGAKIRVAS